MRGIEEAVDMTNDQQVAVLALGERKRREKRIPFGIHGGTLTRQGRRLWPRLTDDGCPILYYDDENNVLCHRCASKSGYSSETSLADRFEEGAATTCDDCGAIVLPNYYEVTVNDEGDFFSIDEGFVGHAVLGSPTQEANGTTSRTLKDLAVNPKARRQGAGEALLTYVCQTADDHEIALYLQPAPNGDGPKPSVERLRRWYRAHGFVACRSRDLRGWMVREPNGWRRV